MARLWFAPVVIMAVLAHGLIFYANRGPFTPQHPPSPDESEYLSLGWGLAHEGRLELPSGEKAKRMPAYPALIALAAVFTEPNDLRSVVLGIQAVLAAASSILAACIARRLSSPLAGIVAGLTCSLYAPLVYLQTLCLSETLVIFLLLVALYSYFVARSGTAFALGFPLSGAALAALVLTRANAAILLVPFAVDVLVSVENWRRKSRNLGLLILPALLALCAWGIRNQRQVGEFRLSTIGGLNLYLGHNPGYAGDAGLANTDYAAFGRLRAETGKTEAAVDRQLRESALEFIKRNPLLTLANTGRKFLVFHQPGTTASAPTLLLICVSAIYLSAFSSKVGTPPSSRHKLLTPAGIAALFITTAATCIEIASTFRPWVYPGHVLLLGLPALFFMRPRVPARRLLIGLYLAVLLVGLAFIPLSRLRWTVDVLLIIAIAVAVANISRTLKSMRLS